MVRVRLVFLVRDLIAERIQSLQQPAASRNLGSAVQERFFDLKVFLDLHVRVKSEWREDEGTLNDIGLK